VREDQAEVGGGGRQALGEGETDDDWKDGEEEKELGSQALS
jgi:hypothetical protein